MANTMNQPTIESLHERVANLEKTLIAISVATASFEQLTPVTLDTPQVSGETPALPPADSTEKTAEGITPAINPAIGVTPKTLPTLDEMREDPSLIPDSWDRPYGDQKPTRIPKLKLLDEAKLTGDEDVIASAQAVYDKYLLDRATRHLKKMNNIETSTVAEADDKTYAVETCKLDIARLQAVLGVAEPKAEAETGTPPPPPAEPKAEAETGTPPPPPAEKVTPVYDTRDLPVDCGYMFTKGIPENENYKSHVDAGWTLDLMLEHGKIIDIPVVSEQPEASLAKPITTPQDLSAFIAEALQPNEQGALRDPMAVMNIISEHGESSDDIVPEMYPIVTKAILALPQNPVT